jgi:hypothetical protein
VLSGSKIGEKCNIGQNVVIGPDVTIGKMTIVLKKCNPGLFRNNSSELSFSKIVISSEAF